MSTTEPTIFTLPVINPNRPTPSLSPSSTSSLTIEDLPELTLPRGLEGDFEAPHLIVPIDKSNASKIIENGYSAQLSSAVSTLVVYDIKPSYAGKTCTLTFCMPPAFDYPELSPLKIRSPGGIGVSRVKNQISPQASVNDVGSSTPVGSVPAIEPGHQYNIANGFCEAGQRVAYQIDSTAGLEMSWFQLVNPPLGPFVMVS